MARTIEEIKTMLEREHSFDLSDIHVVMQAMLKTIQQLVIQNAELASVNRDLLDTIEACLIAAGGSDNIDTLESQVKAAGRKPSDFIRQQIERLKSHAKENA